MIWNLCPFLLKLNELRMGFNNDGSLATEIAAKSPCTTLRLLILEAELMGLATAFGDDVSAAPEPFP